MVNIKKLTNKIINYAFYRNYGPKNYPKKFRYIIKFCDQNIKNQKTIIKKSLYNDKKIIKLASKKLKINIKKLNNNLNFPDSEDQGYIHRWSWALNLNLKKPNLNNQ